MSYSVLLNMDIFGPEDILITLTPINRRDITVRVVVGENYYRGMVPSKYLDILRTINDVRIDGNYARLCAGEYQFAIMKTSEETIDTTLIKHEKTETYVKRIKEQEDTIAELRLRINELEKLVCGIALSNDGIVLIKKIMEEQL